jgi:U4/U6 small nuclear ribonucleoprotein PRP4
MTEYLELSAESKAEQAKHAESLRKLAETQRARNIVVPTDINEIKSRLRELGQPVTLFGEGPADRRERLRETIASLELNDEELTKVQDIINKRKLGTHKAEAAAQSKEVLYSPATEAMVRRRHSY